MRWFVVVTAAVGLASLLMPANGPALAASPPLLTSPSDGALVGDSVDVSAESAAPAVAFRVDGSIAQIDDSAPFEQTLSVTPGGVHTLDVVECSDSTTCTGAASSVISVTCVSPDILSSSPEDISPNGDGRYDAVTVSYTVPVSAQVQVDVIGPTNESVLSRDLGPVSSGTTHSWRWNGRMASGGVAPDGGYWLVLTASANDSSGRVSATNASFVQVDATGPRVDLFAADPPSLYPYPDHYRDTMHLSGNVFERRVQARFEVRNVRHRVVWTHAFSTTSPLQTLRATWNGHSERGVAVPPGSYQYRLTAHDALQNVTSSKWIRFSVSGKRRATVTRSVLVSGLASLRRIDDELRCAHVVKRPPGLPHGLGYRFGALCRPPGLTTAHRGRVPKEFLNVSWWRVDTLARAPRGSNVRDVAWTLVTGDHGPPTSWSVTHLGWNKGPRLAGRSGAGTWALDAWSPGDLEAFRVVWHGQALVDP